MSAMPEIACAFAQCIGKPDQYALIPSPDRFRRDDQNAPHTRLLPLRVPVCGEHFTLAERYESLFKDRHAAHDELRALKDTIREQQQGGKTPR